MARILPILRIMKSFKASPLLAFLSIRGILIAASANVLNMQLDGSSDPNFVGLDVPDVIFVNVDDETPGYTITSISGNTNEFGLKASFAIRLNTKPDNSSTPVQLGIRSSDTTEGIIDTTSVEFTDTNWNAYILRKI